MIMAHALVKALVIPDVVGLICEKYSLSEAEALERFYKSSVAMSLSDDETGLYGQSGLYIFSLFVEEYDKEWQL
jgi:hypothetical protein